MDACERFREMAWAQPGELDDAEQADLDRHLAECEDCRSEVEGVATVRESLAPAPDEEGPGLDVLARVKRRLATAAEAAAPVAEVLTPEEVAAFLQITLEELYENLDQLPVFEFAGRVRIRRRALEAWIEEKEQSFRQQSLAARRLR